MKQPNNNYDAALFKSILGLANLLTFGDVASYSLHALNSNEQGFSGAKLCRAYVYLKDGEFKTMVLKKTELKERMAMHTLTVQGHKHTPAAYSSDLTSSEPNWIAMEDLAEQRSSIINNIDWKSSVASAIAEIHLNNLGNACMSSWLPTADKVYWTNIASIISLDHFEQAASSNNAFFNEFGSYLPSLRRNAARFINDMTALSAEKSCLTLTHGDIQSPSGDHVYNCSGVPYIIDFGFCSYAPFYIDLVSYFDFDDIDICYAAFSSQGVHLSKTDFEYGFRAAFCYGGFLYFYPAIMNYLCKPNLAARNRLNELIAQALLR